MVSSGAHVKQKPGNGAEVIGQQIAVLRVEPKYAFAHGEIVVPAAEAHARAGERVVALDDRCVEGRNDCGWRK